jgi:hypothetical protein
MSKPKFLLTTGASRGSGERGCLKPRALLPLEAASSDFVEGGGGGDINSLTSAGDGEDALAP